MRDDEDVAEDDGGVDESRVSSDGLEGELGGESGSLTAFEEGVRLSKLHELWGRCEIDDWEVEMAFGEGIGRGKRRGRCDEGREGGREQKSRGQPSFTSFVPLVSNPSL